MKGEFNLAFSSINQFIFSKFSFPFVVKLELSSRWLLSSYTVAKLEDVAAKPASILQKTNLIRLMANCQKKVRDE